TPIPTLSLHDALPISARRTARDFAFNKQWIGATPFWMAAAFHKADLIRVLAGSGIDPLSSTSDGTTPLMAAAQGWSPRAPFQDRSEEHTSELQSLRHL